MKNLFLFIFLLFIYFDLYSQNKSYFLKGKVNVDSGIARLIPTSGEEYDPNKGNIYEVKISKGVFTFKGKMLYPCSYIIQIKPNYISDEFIIDPGNQSIVCNIDSLRETPKIYNNSMNERVSYIKYLAPINMQREELRENYFSEKLVVADKKAGDSLKSSYLNKRSYLLSNFNAALIRYSKHHSKSYVVLWDLVKSMKDGYQPVYDTIFASLDINLKKTTTGNVLRQRLSTSKITSIGKFFPTLKLLDAQEKIVTLSSPTFKQSNYLLIDFWFSYCGACFEEFLKYKDYRSSYKKEVFNIIGISIDSRKDINNWKKVIKEKKLYWDQYLDIDGKITTNLLSIKYFPSNFLLDKNGVIIQKNISPEELKIFLEKNVKK